MITKFDYTHKVKEIKSDNDTAMKVSTDSTMAVFTDTAMAVSLIKTNIGKEGRKEVKKENWKC